MQDAENGRAAYEQALAEVETIKEELRDRAAIVAARERELVELRRRLARQLEGAPPDAADAPAPATPAPVTPAPAAPAAADTARLAERERELAEAIAAAERRERAAAAELALAQAERERLDERERAAREVERELAGLRVHLEEQRASLAAAAAAAGLEEPPKPATETAAKPARALRTPKVEAGPAADSATAAPTLAEPAQDDAAPAAAKPPSGRRAPRP